MKKEEISYNLVKLTDKELIDARLHKDEIELDILDITGKLEIQRFKIDNDIAQLELKEDTRDIERSIEDIKNKRDNLDKESELYNDLFLRHNYDILCGEKRLEVAKLQVEKRMGSRMSNEAIRTLDNKLNLCKDNYKLFNDQIRNKVRKERKVTEHVQLDNEK